MFSLNNRWRFSWGNRNFLIPMSQIHMCLSVHSKNVFRTIFTVYSVWVIWFFMELGFAAYFKHYFKHDHHELLILFPTKYEQFNNKITNNSYGNMLFSIMLHMNITNKIYCSSKFIIIILKVKSFSQKTRYIKFSL